MSRINFEFHIHTFQLACCTTFLELFVTVQSYFAYFLFATDTLDLPKDFRLGLDVELA